jgi:hypothetical protein
MGMTFRSAAASILAALALAGLSLAQPQGSSVAALIAVVRKGIQHREKDSKLARDVHKVKLGQRLDDRVIEELESDGAGPETVAELAELRDLTAGLPAPTALPDFPSPPLPLRQEQDEILHSAGTRALSYTIGLPDFICTEVIHRFEDLGGSGKWKLKDILQLKLTYFEHQEKYQLLMVNRHPAPAGFNYESLGGAMSEGEFGSTLISLFQPRSKTEIRWDHWTRLRGHVAHVFFFRIRPENSQYRMDFGTTRTPRVSTTPGQHGFLYVDRESGQVLRINRAADLPHDFPVHAATTQLDYDFSTVAGKPFLLPLRADVRTTTDLVLIRNQIDFTEYRKFSGESTITFEEAK